MIVVNWDNGATSYIESGWWQPYADGPEASTQLYGLEGMAHLFPTGLVLTGEEPKQLEKVASGYPDVRDPHCAQSMYDNQLVYFVDCIDKGTRPVPGGNEGLINMQIVDSAYQSSQSGQVVQINPIS